MKENLTKVWNIIKKVLFWVFIVSFIVAMFQVKVLSVINEDGIKGLCLNPDNNNPCKYNLQIQY